MMKKRIILFVLSLVAWLNIGNIENVYATETQTIAYDENYLFEDVWSAADYLDYEIMQRSECIILNLSEKLYASSSATEVFRNILDYSAMYCDTNGLSYGNQKIDGGCQFEIYPNYVITTKQNMELAEKIEEVLDGLDLEGASEYKKVKAIHDYICEHVDYDYTYTNYYSYDAMFTGKSVCNGYAALFYRMCYAAGLEVETITGIGNGGGHAWNIVKIGDEYYNIDTTWDGQDETTRYNYFLKTEQEFGEHSRDTNFETDEFNEKYPMAEGSWIDFDSVKEGMNIDNIENVLFSTIDGGTVTNQAENGRGKILVFGAVGCGNTKQTLVNIASQDFSDVDVVFVETEPSSLDEVAKLKDEIGGSRNDIIYTYCLDNTSLFALWNYVFATVGGIETYPLIVYIDDENKIQFVDVSIALSAVHIRGIVNMCINDGSLAELSQSSISMEVDSVSRLFINVYGTRRNAQFFEWTSSQPSIVSVDENGKITALKPGTSTVICKVNDNLSYLCKITVLERNVPDGLNKGKDGVWYYYKNNSVDTSYTGLAKNAYGWWYVKNGKLDRTYTGLGKNEYGWWYVKNGKLDRTYTGMAKNEHGWWYVKEGKVDMKYTGLATNQYGTWYMVDGKVASDLSGLTKVSKIWMYLSKGKVDTSFIGLAKNEYGWWHVANGKVDLSYTGMSKNQYGWWYVTNGKLDRSFTGIATNVHGMWYLKNGEVAKTYNGQVVYNGNTYDVVKGKVIK